MLKVSVGAGEVASAFADRPSRKLTGAGGAQFFSVGIGPRNFGLLSSPHWIRIHLQSNPSSVSVKAESCALVLDINSLLAAPVQCGINDGGRNWRIPRWQRIGATVSTGRG